MRRKRVTPEQEAEMREMGATMTAKQISKELDMPYSTVNYYMTVKQIRRKLGKAPPRHGYYTREKDKEGIFNVNKRENWLI